MTLNWKKCISWRLLFLTWACISCVFVVTVRLNVSDFHLPAVWLTQEQNPPINSTHIDGFLMERVSATYTRNIYFTVKTTSKYFQSRLLSVALTWLQVVDANKVSIITDKNIPEQVYLENTGFRVINTDCLSTHKFIPLCCKLSAEFAAYYEAIAKHPGQESNYHWYCHCDDDVYVNVPLLSQVLQQYDAHKPYYFGRLPSCNRKDLSPTKEVILTEEKLRNLYKTSYPLKFIRFKYATGAFFCMSYSLMMEAKKYFNFNLRMALTVDAIDGHGCIHSNKMCYQLQPHYFFIIEKPDVYNYCQSSWTSNDTTRNGPESFIPVSKSIHDSDDVTAGFVITALLGHKLTELLAIKNEYDSQLINASMNEFTQKYVTVSRVKDIVASLKEFVSLKVFASSLKTPLSPDPTGFLLLHCMLYPNVSWCPRRN